MLARQNFKTGCGNSAYKFKRGLAPKMPTKNYESSLEGISMLRSQLQNHAMSSYSRVNSLTWPSWGKSCFIP